MACDRDERLISRAFYEYHGTDVQYQNNSSTAAYIHCIQGFLSPWCRNIAVSKKHSRLFSKTWSPHSDLPPSPSTASSTSISIADPLTDKLASWWWKASSSSPSQPEKPAVVSQNTVDNKQRISTNRKMSTKRMTVTAPPLTPALCFNTSYLRDFLRLSRAQLDDTINTNLNSLVIPSITSPFDPSSTSDPSTNRQGRTPIAQGTCTDFTEQTIFPIWASRSQVLSYCSIVATSPDPDDPDKSRIEAENMAQSHRVINERLDPYSGRFFPKEPRTELLAGLLRNESAVENIVRDRTWRILNERCNGLDPSQRGWQEAFKNWQDGKPI